VSRVKFINLTPHSVDIYSEDGTKITSIQPSGIVLRAPERRRLVGKINGIPVYSVDYLLPQLPPRREGVIYIVSTIVLQVMRMKGIKREDFVAPDTLNAIRNHSGRIIGVRGFIKVGDE